MAKTKSGSYWVDWANSNAKNSTSTDDLVDPFKTNAEAFIKALEDAGAKVVVTSTYRDSKRAYLFHWSWKIALGKAKAKYATPMTGVDIEWNHDNDFQSKTGAQEMVTGFDLAVPPNSNVAPSLHSNHTPRKAIDMKITWNGTIKVARKDGTPVDVPFVSDPNKNTLLHNVGARVERSLHRPAAIDEPPRRLIRAKTRSEPLCMQICRCGQMRRGCAAITSTNARETSVASMLDRRTRKSASISISRARRSGKRKPLSPVVASAFDALPPFNHQSTP
jgi:hypothetical protein